MKGQHLELGSDKNKNQTAYKERRPNSTAPLAKSSLVTQNEI